MKSMEAVIEDLKSLLRLERKKLILPIILILIFFFWITVDNITYNEVENSKPVIDTILDGLKLSIYNYSLGGADKNLEAQLVQKMESSHRAQEEITGKLTPYVILLGGSETVLNAFGIPYCIPQSMSLSYYTSDICIISRSYGQIILELSKMGCKVGLFTKDYFNTSTYIGSRLNSTSMEIRHEFIYSEEGQNIFDFYEDRCAVSFGDLEKPEKFIGTSVGFISFYKESPRIILLPAELILLVIIILFVEGYVISSILLAVYRRYKEHKIVVEVRKKKSSSILYAGIRRGRR